MRDQIIPFTEKRDFIKIFFVIRDAHILRDTWRTSKWNLNTRDSSVISAREPWQSPPPPPCTTLIIYLYVQKNLALNCGYQVARVKFGQVVSLLQIKDHNRSLTSRGVPLMFAGSIIFKDIWSVYNAKYASVLAVLDLPMCLLHIIITRLAISLSIVWIAFDA